MKKLIYFFLIIGIFSSCGDKTIPIPNVDGDYIDQNGHQWSFSEDFYHLQIKSPVKTDRYRIGHHGNRFMAGLYQQQWGDVINDILPQVKYEIVVVEITDQYIVVKMISETNGVETIHQLYKL